MAQAVGIHITLSPGQFDYFYHQVPLGIFAPGLPHGGQRAAFIVANTLEITLERRDATQIFAALSKQISHLNYFYRLIYLKESLTNTFTLTQIF